MRRISLRRRVQQLEAENRRLREENAALRALVAKLEARIAILERQLGSGPQGPSASTLVAKTPPPDPKKPGRRPGHEGTSWSVPDDLPCEVVDLKLKSCPECGGRLTRWRGHQDHFVLDLPPIRPLLRNFRHEQAWCRHCKKVVRAPRAPQEPPSGHLGPRLLALAADLKTQAGMTFGKITQLFAHFGVEVTPSALTECVQRVAKWLKPCHDEILAEVRAAALVHPDETSWPIGGRLAWLWTAVTDSVTAFRVAATRSAKDALALLGSKSDRVVVRDSYSAYSRIEGEHQLCFAHPLRHAREAAGYGDPAAKRFHADLKAIYREAELVCEAREALSPRVYVNEVRRVERRLANLAKGKSKNPLVQHLKKRIAREKERLLTFLHRPGVEPTNNRAEREIRPAVVVRKISGGSRSDGGAQAHAVITSIERSIDHFGASLIDLICEAACPARSRSAFEPIFSN
jgi:transposase